MLQQHDLLLACVCCTAAEEEGKGPADDGQKNSHNESDRGSCDRNRWEDQDHMRLGLYLGHAGFELTDEFEVARVVHSRPTLNADHWQRQAVHCCCFSRVGGAFRWPFDDQMSW